MCFLCSAQPDFKDEASRVPPSPKRIQNYPTQSYPNPNISYRQPVSHENTQHDDSDDSTATHIIEKSDLFNVNGRPKSSIVYSKDSVTVTRPTTCGSESRTDLKFTVEIEPVEQVTIKTPPKTPERSVIYTKSPTPSPYRSTTPPKSPKFTHSQQPDITELYERHVSPNFTEAPIIITRESPKKASPVKVLPPVEHYPDKHYIQSVQTVPTISSNASVQDSYESTTDNEQYKKPVRAVKKVKQSGQGSGGEASRKKKYDDSYSNAKYAEKPEKPRDLIVSCFVQLQSTNWEEIMEVW